MRYISTRGGAAAADFETVLLTGLAPDGGLFVPEQLPQFAPEQIASWQGLSYGELALQILPPFLDEDAGELLEEAVAAWDSFACPEVTPLRAVGTAADAIWVLELFHGPSLSFKDCALQFMGALLDAVLRRSNSRALVLGATSGDTGSAAIAAVAACSRVDIAILHPHRRLSEVQRRQMTTVRSDAVHNLALTGNFDDCQSIVKDCFRDRSFLLPELKLVAANSINWARIMAQTVYYFYAHLQLGAPAEGAVYSVPSGNFGDAYAGYLARGMGMPMRRLVVAVNRNRVLEEFFGSGCYRRGELFQTLSPSMDIAVSSNLERLIFDICGRDGRRVATAMREFAECGEFSLAEAEFAQLAGLFRSMSVDDEQTCAQIAELYRQHGYLLDPHSAIGMYAGRQWRQRDGLEAVPLVCLATAHPAKFPDAIARAIGTAPPPPAAIAALSRREEHYTVLPATAAAVREYLAGLPGLRH